MNSGSKHSCIVVGAGISGLVAASILQDNGLDVTVLEKSRGVGGRMATRRIHEKELRTAYVDHGAQFITVRDERFRQMVEEWQSEDVAKEWCRGFPSPDSPEPDSYPRYRGTTGMTSIPKYLARGIDVRVNQKVAEINIGADMWEVKTEAGDRFEGDSLILSPPVPESLLLIDSGNVTLPEKTREKLEEIEYAPCIALMAVLKGESNVPHPGGIKLPGEPISWIADNRKKGISPELSGVTIHAGPEFSREHRESGDEEIADLLLKDAREWIGETFKKVEIHRWRYSLPLNIYPEPFLFVDNAPLLFIGDAFAGPRVEGAAISGMEAAERLLLEYQ